MKTRSKVRTAAGLALGAAVAAVAFAAFPIWVAVFVLAVVSALLLELATHDPATCQYCQAQVQLREPEAEALRAEVTALRAEVAGYRAQVGELYNDERAADERARSVLADRQQQRERWLRELADWGRMMDALEQRAWRIPDSSSRPVAFQKDQGAPS